MPELRSGYEKGDRVMAMRDYQNLKDIVIPKEQEEIMEIFSKAWEDCNNVEHCASCPDRPKGKTFALLECFSLKYSRMLIEAGYTPVAHGEWKLKHVGAGHYWECSVCHTNPCIYVTENTKFCPNCGAKMDGSTK